MLSVRRRKIYTQRIPVLANLIIVWGRASAYMQTNLSTLSSWLMIPACTIPCTIATPTIGMTIIFPKASPIIAPTGNSDSFPNHVLHGGNFNRASAEPRHMSPSGTLAAPIKFAVSRMKARGGWPSGAFGIGEGPEPGGRGVKSALSGVMSAMGKAKIIANAGGVRRDFNEGRMRDKIRRERGAD